MEGRFPSRFGARIIVEGETGFLVEDIDCAVEAEWKIEQISRARCHREFEQKFTDRDMAEDYIRIYRQFAAVNLLKQQPRVASTPVWSGLRSDARFVTITDGLQPNSARR